MYCAILRFMGNMLSIKAAHANGYVKLSVVRKEADAAAYVAGLEKAGYWLGITVSAWVPMFRKLKGAA